MTVPALFSDMTPAEVVVAIFAGTLCLISAALQELTA